ncbi:MAG: A24 family peptidase [Acidobacteria bacterium]|nr:A24 family peptidase [Acidobacteriota bacterium]
MTADAWTLAALAGVLGLMVGSFLNVCIHRLPRRESIIWPASRCPACGHPIRWVHNVPLVGFLVLGGRCASCRAPISSRYPIVEAVTGGLFVLHVAVIGPEWLLVPRLLFAAAMVALFAIDLEHQILPNVITLPGIVAGLAFSLALPPGLTSAVIGAVAGGGLPYLIAWAYFLWRGVDGLGFGDVKMLAMIGAFLGWPAMLLTLALASVTGALVGGALILLGRGDGQLKLPFGTFLAVGALVASLWGDGIILWYTGFYE